jgi:hypothetical protein
MQPFLVVDLLNKMPYVFEGIFKCLVFIQMYLGLTTSMGVFVPGIISVGALEIDSFDIDCTIWLWNI